MKGQRAFLAKTSRPDPPAVVERKGLFRLLDRARKRPILWLAGLPGSGKTTLVASYLEARRLPGIWYQVDAGDADIATFFAYLRLAARRAGRGKRKPLPLLSPEYWMQLSVFTRRYFRDLYSRMPLPFALVFDNYQEVPEYSRFHEVVADALKEIPQEGWVIVISRAEPPPALARFRAAGAMALIGSDELRLTKAEARAIAKLRGQKKMSGKEVLGLHQRTDGWAAGLVLMLEGVEREAGASPPSGDLEPGAVFDYFAAEILEKEDSQTRDFLLKSAFLDKVTAATAERLTGVRHPERILSALSRRNYFTDRRSHPAVVYQYHPLFREFLRNRARATFSPEQLSRLQCEAAALLAKDGYIEDAVNLLRDARNWPAMARLVVEEAPVLMAQGRALTLEEWMGSIPGEIFQRDPWLEYWLGSCRLLVTPPQSRDHFERAFRIFEEQNERAGLFSAWCGAVGSILYEWGDFTRLDRWIGRLEEILERELTFPSPEIETRVASDMFGALMFRQPQHPRTTSWADRAFSLSRASPDVNRRLLTGFMLALYYLWLGDFAKATVVIEWLRQIGRSREASPLVAITLKLVAAYYHLQAAAHEACLNAVSEGLDLARTTGVQVWNTLLRGQGAGACLSAGDLPGARRLLEKMAERLDGTRLLNVSHYHHLAGWEAALNGDLPLAREHAERALELAVEMGTPWPEALNHLALSQVLHEGGEADEASRHLERGLEIARAVSSKMLQFMGLLAKAWLSLSGGERVNGPKYLAEAMEIGRRGGYFNTSWWRPAVMASLCVEALERGIEVDYVRDLIRRRGLVPDRAPVDVERWPWPIRIYCLGRFGVVKEGDPLTFPRKAQQKPIALLQALIALGGGGVAEEELADALWPDAEGDAAHRAFATTLHRLRQLLGSEQAVSLRAGKVALNPAECWVDVWAFQKLLARANDMEGREAAREAAELTGRALALYSGPFLPQASREPWAISLAERLRASFLRHTGKLCRWLEEEGEWRHAVEAYEKALETDDLAEEFYRRLMSCYGRAGRRAEALSVYERCRRVLAARLGVEPAPETEALYRRLRQG